MNKQENIPALRFPEFTGNWVVKKLGDVAEIIMGQSPDGDSYNTIGLGTPLINGPVEFTEKYPVKIKWTSKPTKFCQDKDVLFCVRGSTTGRMNIANDKYCIGRGVAAIRANKHSTSLFIEFILIRNLEVILSFTTGSTFQNIDSKSLREFDFQIPTLPEQQKIATFLSSVDEKLQGLKKKKSLLEAYKKGMMQRLFSQTLRFKDENGEDFPEWEEKTLGEVATNKSRKYNPEQETESVKCIELEHLASGTSQLLGYIDGKNSGSIKNRFNSGDILFGKLRPYLRKYLHAPFDGVCSSEIWVLSGKNISNDFLFRLVQTEFFIDLANQSSGSKMPRADWNVIENGLFLLPTLPEQTKIANFLSAIDEKIAKVSQEIEQATVWKKGLLQQMFV